MSPEKLQIIFSHKKHHKEHLFILEKFFILDNIPNKQYQNIQLLK